MMSLSDSITYIWDNPVSQGSVRLAKSALNTCINLTRHQAPPQTAPQVIMQSLPSLYKLAGSTGWFLRLAGLSGAGAVGLGAYGAHSIMNREGNERQKQVFETANKYHFYNTLALLAVPLAKYPLVTGSLLSSGMVLFCLPTYYMSITGQDFLRKVTPFGGVLFIIGWMSFML